MSGRGILLTFLLLLSLRSWGTFTLTAVSGVSGSNVTDKTIFGGMAGTCDSAAMDAVNTCNSCVGGGLTACNKARVYPDLAVRLTFKTDKANLSNTATTVTFKPTNTTSSSGVQSHISKSVNITTNTEFTVGITWGEFCQMFGEGLTCSTTGFDATTGYLNGVADVGIDASNSGTPEADQKTALNVKLNKLPAINFDALTNTCPVGSGIDVGYSSSSNVGICDFKIFPGDQKIYLLEFRKGAFASDGALTPQFDGYPYSGLMLFYAKVTSTDEAAVDSITNASDSKEFSYKIVDSEVEINDNRASGFDNDQKYCFISANKNAAGNIFYFAPPAAIKSNLDDHCGTPSEVIGLLDNKKCFIATATFGSPIAPEVENFRAFRNQYLLTNSWGKAFVKFYYKHSPPLAQFITEYPVFKWFSWAFLWPLSLWIRLVFALGLLPSLLVGLLAMVFIRQALNRTLKWRQGVMK